MGEVQAENKELGQVWHSCATQPEQIGDTQHVLGWLLLDPSLGLHDLVRLRRIHRARGQGELLDGQADLQHSKGEKQRQNVPADT